MGVGFSQFIVVLYYNVNLIILQDFLTGTEATYSELIDQAWGNLEEIILRPTL